MPAVLNKKTIKPGERGVYCGRGSKWGNRNQMRTESDRDAVCDQHEVDLFRDYALLRSLDELRGQNLICFCAPRRCHGDLLLRLANATREERIDWFKRVRARLGASVVTGCDEAWQHREPNDIQAS